MADSSLATGNALASSKRAPNDTERSPNDLIVREFLLANSPLFKKLDMLRDKVKYLSNPQNSCNVRAGFET